MACAQAANDQGHGARRALVTGASSGIGAAIVEKLLEDGWDVLGLSRTRPELDSPRFTHIPVDLSSRDDLDRCLGEIDAVDAVVHSAGKLRVGTIGQLALDDGQEMWRLHVESAVQILDALISRIPDGGRVVLIGSRTARGSASRGQYAATKAALTGFARSLAIEVAPRRIAVNVVSPGATDTPMLQDPARQSVSPKMPPMGRLIQPAEIAALTSYLLSDAAASITGQEIVVCGGASL